MQVGFNSHDELEELHYLVCETVAVHAGLFPEGENLTCWHQIIHFPSFIAKMGPIKGWWAFGGERAIHFIKSFVPEGGIKFEKTALVECSKQENARLQLIYNKNLYPRKHSSSVNDEDQENDDMNKSSESYHKIYLDLKSHVSIKTIGNNDDYNTDDNNDDVVTSSSCYFYNEFDTKLILSSSGGSKTLRKIELDDDDDDECDHDYHALLMVMISYICQSVSSFAEAMNSSPVYRIYASYLHHHGNKFADIQGLFAGSAKRKTALLFDQYIIMLLKMITTKIGIENNNQTSYFKVVEKYQTLFYHNNNSFEEYDGSVYSCDVSTLTDLVLF